MLQHSLLIAKYLRHLMYRGVELGMAKTQEHNYSKYPAQHLVESHLTARTACGQLIRYIDPIDGL